MRLKMITLNGELVNQDIYSLTIPTVDGEIGVFPGHEPLVTLASSGVLAVSNSKEDLPEEREYFAISGGVVKISQSEVKILVDEADHGEDIIESESKAALDRAIAMRDKASSQVELEEAHQLVDRHMVRLKVAELKRRRRK